MVGWWVRGAWQQALLSGHPVVAIHSTFGQNFLRLKLKTQGLCIISIRSWQLFWRHDCYYHTVLFCFKFKTSGPQDSVKLTLASFMYMHFFKFALAFANSTTTWAGRFFDGIPMVWSTKPVLPANVYVFLLICRKRLCYLFMKPSSAHLYTRVTELSIKFRMKSDSVITVRFVPVYDWKINLF